MINFPNLNIYLNVSPVAFYVGGFPVYFYGLIMSFSLIVGCFIVLKLAKDKGLDCNKIIDCIIWTIPSAIIGARLYFVLSNIKEYSSFYDAINIRQGGIAIYGAAIAGTIAVYIFCKIKKESFLTYADCFAPALIIGQAIGRWGNFFNSEAYGTAYNGFFRMEIVNSLGNLISVHPTFLYESLWCLAGFILLIILAKKFVNSGNSFYIYLVWYGIGRFFIEGLRVDSLPYGASFKISQIVSILLIIGGIIMLVRNKHENRDR